MNPFDRAIFDAINSFAGHSWALDRGMLLLGQSDILQGSVAVASFWWAWFLPHPDQARRRRLLLAVLGGAFLALILCRLAALGLPFRMRPIHDTALKFVVPIGMSRNVLQGWSAFPSDHASLAFSMAVGLWFVSRAAGALLLAQAVFLICLPRVYLGLHYPTDILGGALLGTAAAWTMTRPATSSWLARPLLLWETRSPGIFYPGLALLSIQIADMTREARAIVTFAGVLFRAIAHH